MADWRPTTTLEQLKQRAALHQHIHQFFAARDVLEVITPQLAQHGVSDPNVPSIAVPDYGYLQTSPEFHMKRLLANLGEAAPSIYQISHAFRQGESGSRHNPEFTLLEWYRINFSLQDLIDEVCELLKPLLKPAQIHQYRFKDLFERYVGLNPHTADLSELYQRAQSLNPPENLSTEQLVDLLMAIEVERQLPVDELIVVTEFPHWAAALSQISSDDTGEKVAQRFECYFAGLELANGYLELQDASEHMRRIKRDNQNRHTQSLPHMHFDSNFLNAIKNGLPNCSGVAVGLERVLMAQYGHKHINATWNFPTDIA